LAKWEKREGKKQRPVHDKRLSMSGRRSKRKTPDPGYGPLALLNDYGGREKSLKRGRESERVERTAARKFI